MVISLCLITLVSLASITLPDFSYPSFYQNMGRIMMPCTTPPTITNPPWKRIIFTALRVQGCQVPHILQKLGL